MLSWAFVLFTILSFSIQRNTSEQNNDRIETIEDQNVHIDPAQLELELLDFARHYKSDVENAKWRTNWLKVVKYTHEMIEINIDELKANKTEFIQELEETLKYVETIKDTLLKYKSETTLGHIFLGLYREFIHQMESIIYEQLDIVHGKPHKELIMENFNVILMNYMDNIRQYVVNQIMVNNRDINDITMNLREYFTINKQFLNEVVSIDSPNLLSGDIYDGIRLLITYGFAFTSSFLDMNFNFIV